MSQRLVVTALFVGVAIFALSGCTTSSEVEQAGVVEETKVEVEVKEPVIEKVEEVEEPVIEKVEEVEDAVVKKAEEIKSKGFNLRVNCAAYELYTDKAGNKWLPDQEMEEGKKWGAIGGLTIGRGELDIADTDAPAIYQTERYSMDAYKFIVPNGKYTVRLHFAETYNGIYGEGERVFSVAINGKTILADFDPYKEGGGFEKPIVKEFIGVDVTGEEIVVGFTANIENPEINGIEILSK